MNSGDVVTSMTMALYSALMVDLPSDDYVELDYESQMNYLRTIPEDARLAYHKARGVVFSSTNNAEARVEFAESHGIKYVRRSLRPSEDTCNITMFRQLWGSTALGFGGIGGQAMTHAYTVVVTDENTGWSAVYFAGKLAYTVAPESYNDAWREALNTRKMPHSHDAVRLFNAKTKTP